MIDNNEAIAGQPPYERGYHAMGYLEGAPSLRIVTIGEIPLSPTEAIEVLYQNIEDFSQSKALCKSFVITNEEELTEALSLTDVQHLYIKATLLLDNYSRESFINLLSSNDKMRILVDCPHDGFKTIAMLRTLRSLVKCPITCWVHSFTQYLYALLAQTDDLICDSKNKELVSAENQLLIENSLVSKTIDPFFP